VHVGPVGARDRQPDRLGAGGEQKAVIGKLRAVAQDHFPRAYIESNDLGAEAEVNAVLAIVAGGPQRHPFLGRVPGKVVLGQVRPIHGRCIVVAQD